MIDGAHGGSSDAYGILMSDAYASGQQPLEGGNVIIHKNRRVSLAAWRAVEARHAPADDERGAQHVARDLRPPR